ncbi:hypothetical protein SAV14893_080510 [Streptomyces avermitilis]|uniref:Uncharacterized protein n=1 Tax=Streptomyces avermitilis TaxID=33903 RepID=A0A4D4M9W9_STRAX|nr:hypothetical protein SAV14893_080510 [Streptomyces avermitilis]
MLRRRRELRLRVRVLSVRHRPRMRARTWLLGLLRGLVRAIGLRGLIRPGLLGVRGGCGGMPCEGGGTGGCDMGCCSPSRGRMAARGARLGVDDGNMFAGGIILRPRG